MNLSIVKEAIKFMSDQDISAVAKVRPEVRSLLADLEFIIESEGLLSFADHAEQNTNLLNVLTYFSNFFPMFSVQSPALFAFGAEVELKNNVRANQKGKVSSTTGSGMKPGKAMKSCLGEVAERLAQYQDNGLAVAHITGDQRRVLDFNSENGRTGNRFLPAHCLHTNEQVLVPENDCVYGTRHSGCPIPTKVECGAGVSLAIATLHGLYELVERDAVSLFPVNAHGIN